MATISSDPALVGTGARELYQLLRDGVPRTRAQLAASTGLARSTIAARVAELVRMGLITPVAEGVSTGGRPPSLFALNPRARIVVAVDIGASHATVALLDLTGLVLAQRSQPLDVALGPVHVLTWVTETTTALLSETGRTPMSVVAVGVGVPGPVEHSTGQPVNPPIMPGWDRFDVPGWVQQHLEVPVLVDNDVNMMALGERAVTGSAEPHLIFVKVATGIGAGVISDGHLQRGAQGVAGDIGHVHVPRGADVPCHCGNRGCLEAIASGPAIARDLRARGIPAADGDDVVALVKGGSVEAIQAVRQAGRDIGTVLTVCVSLMNPSVIALGGSMARVGEHLIAGVREVVYSRSIPLASEHLSIVPSVAGKDAAIIGAGMLAIEHALSPAAFHGLAG